MRGAEERAGTLCLHQEFILHWKAVRRVATLDENKQAGAELNNKEANTMEIKRSEARTSRDGREDYFTGAAKIDDLFRLEGPTATEAVWVTFQPGARTA